MESETPKNWEDSPLTGIRELEEKVFHLVHRSGLSVEAILQLAAEYYDFD